MHLLQKPFYFGYGRGTTVEEKAIQVTGSGTSQQGFVLHSSPQAADYQLQRPNHFNIMFTDVSKSHSLKNSILSDWKKKWAAP